MLYKRVTTFLSKIHKIIILNFISTKWIDKTYQKLINFYNNIININIIKIFNEVIKKIYLNKNNNFSLILIEILNFKIIFLKKTLHL